MEPEHQRPVLKPVAAMPGSRPVAPWEEAELARPRHLEAEESRSREEAEPRPRVAGPFPPGAEAAPSPREGAEVQPQSGAVGAP